MNKVSLLVADCHDSFVYNLVEVLRSFHEVCHFDIAPVEQCLDLPLHNYQGILLSPGPGHPEETIGLMPLIKKTYQTHPLLGVCLGHQALTLHFGGGVSQMPHPLHGHADSIQIIKPNPLFNGFPMDSPIGRYHSWVVDPEQIPKELCVTALSRTDGSIMALRHQSLPIYGVQFHPESYLSPHGATIVRNWVESL